MRSAADGGAEGMKVRHAFLILDNDLAVENGVIGGNEFGGLGDHGELVSPIQAGACEHGCCSGTKMKLRAVPIELDLILPLLTRRRLGAQRRLAWFDERREGGCLSAGQGASDEADH